MKNLNTITAISQLEINEIYLEDVNGYYLATCKNIDTSLQNNSFNQYYQTATFDIKSKHGRFVETVTKSFFVNL